jgi:2-haloacid dehalogenase
LIDWETGILDALAPLRRDSDRDVEDDAVLERYALVESRIQAGEFKRYREVLEEVGREMAASFDVDLRPGGEGFLAGSIAGWKPFPDTVSALAKLKERFRLAIVSNIDDDLIALSVNHLQIDFDHVVTAEQVGSYKPSHNNFLRAIERVGVSKREILHVAQSLYHDIRPANELGLSNAWVNRRKGRLGFGATAPATATPTLEVSDLATLAALV